MKVRKYYYLLATDERRGFVAGILKFFLLLSSLLYRLVIRFILLRFTVGIARTHKLGCKVISIGNITWGGTGKTPLVQMLAKRFADHGRRPAVLIRGYGEDEDRFLEGQLSGIPVLVGRDRLKNGRKAIDEHAVDTLILDDGFQHWGVFRDVDLLTINSLNPFGNGHLLPRGVLREPVASLKRADCFFLTKTDLVQDADLARIRERLTGVNSQAAIVESIHEPICLYGLAKEEVGLGTISGKSVATLCGIGDPRSFQRTVEALDATCSINFEFLDHYRYTDEDLKGVIDRCQKSDVEMIITTEKDMVRLRDLMGSPKFAQGSDHPSAGLVPGSQLRILALRIQLRITVGEERLDDLLFRVFSG